MLLILLALFAAFILTRGFGRTYAIMGLEMCSLNIQFHNIGPVYVKENDISE